jgi:hypothetical protein
MVSLYSKDEVFRVYCNVCKKKTKHINKTSLISFIEKIAKCIRCGNEQKVN